jgi:hypothetical protein
MSRQYSCRWIAPACIAPLQNRISPGSAAPPDWRTLSAKTTTFAAIST